MDRRGWTLAGGALALVALALWWRMHGDATASPASAPAAPASVLASPAPDVSNPAGDTVAATAAPDLLKALSDPPPHSPPPPPPVFPEPLPPWDAKLVDVLPALKARADAGDHVAACHIGLALSACAMSLSYAPSKAEIRQVDPKDTRQLSFLAMRSMDGRRPGREQTCEGLQDTTIAERFRYLQQAADAGIGAAMRAFVDGGPFEESGALVRHAEWLRAYRERTPHYVRQLLARADPEMVRLLGGQLDGMRVGLMAQTLELSEREAAVYFRLRSLLNGHPETAIPANWASPENIMVAEREAQRLFADRFGGRTIAPQQQGFRRTDPFEVESCRMQP
jgi:hypothetical protein